MFPLSMPLHRHQKSELDVSPPLDFFLLPFLPLPFFKITTPKVHLVVWGELPQCDVGRSPTEIYFDALWPKI